MGRDIVEGLCLIVCPADDTVAGHHDSTDGHLSLVQCPLRLAQGHAHEALVALLLCLFFLHDRKKNDCCSFYANTLQKYDKPFEIRNKILIFAD